MVNILEKYPVLSLSILVLSMLLINLSVPNITIMEARNFITAREMLQDNHWILTTLNGEPRYQKPPLPTWLTTFSGMLFGIKNIVALRLPAVLMVLFTVIYGYLFSKKLNLSKNQSFRNGLVIVTSFYVIGILIEAPWDIFAHGFTLASIYYFFSFYNSHKTNWRNVFLAGILLGFSILSKGPVSLYALFIPFLISFGFTFGFKNIKSKIFPIIVFILITAVIGTSWYLYVRIMDPVAFSLIMTKETTNWSNYNVKPIYYYWSFFIQSGIWTIPAFIGLLYPYLIKRVENKKVYKFTFLWTVISVILLSLIPEKKARYLMPVLIPLALNTGFYIHFLIHKFKIIKSKKEQFPVYFNFGIIGLCAILTPLFIYFLLENNLEQYFLNYILTGISFIIIGITILISLFKKNAKNLFYLTVLFMVSILLFGLPLSKVFNKNDSYYPLSNLHNIENNLNIETYSFGEITPELIWDYKGIIIDIYRSNELILPKDLKFGILISENEIENLKNLIGSKYRLEFKETYNQNVGSKTKERLIRQFYLVSKK